MPDRIERFEEQIGVLDAGSFRPVLPDFADAGDAFRGVGRSLLQTAEPILARKAEEKATVDAGMLKVAKADDGSYYERPSLPKGKGTVYLDKFNAIVDRRLLAAYAADHEEQAARFQQLHKNDPQGFNESITGWSEGILAKVDGRIRPQLEEFMIRENAQRFNRVLDEKNQSSLRLMAGEVKATVDLKVARMRSAVESQSLSAIGEIEGLRAEARAAYQDLIDAGEILPATADAEVEKVMVELGNEIRFVEEINAFGSIIPGIMGGGSQGEGISRADAALLQQVMDGAPIGDHKILEMTADQWREKFSDPRTRNHIQQYARKREEDVEEAERKEAAAARGGEVTDLLERQLDATEKLLDEGNAEPTAGLSRREVAEIEYGMTDGGKLKLTDMAQSPEGRKIITATAAKYGYIPKAVIEWANGVSGGARIENLAEWMKTLYTVKGPTGSVGVNFWNDLDDTTRLRIETYWTLKRTETPEQSAVATLDMIERDELLTPSKAISLTPQYGTRKLAVLETAYGTRLGEAGVAALRVNRKLNDDFDRLYPINLNIHRGHESKALAATARAVGRFYAVGPLFMGGVGPRRVSAALSGLTKGELDDAFGLDTDDDVKTGGASFANGRARVRPNYAPNGSVDSIDVVMLERPGRGNEQRIVGYRRYKLDEVLKVPRRVAAARQKAKNAKDLREARAAAARAKRFPKATGKEKAGR